MNSPAIQRAFDFDEILRELRVSHDLEEGRESEWSAGFRYAMREAAAIVRKVSKQTQPGET